MTDASYLPGTLAACDTIADEPAAAPGEPSPAACWDAEYRAGRYSNEPPVAFAQDVVAAARQAGVARGLYVGCGNGRNYLPLVEAGLDLTGLDISAAAISQLAARVRGRRDRSLGVEEKEQAGVADEGGQAAREGLLLAAGEPVAEEAEQRPAVLVTAGRLPDDPAARALLGAGSGHAVAAEPHPVAGNSSSSALARPVTCQPRS